MGGLYLKSYRKTQKKTRYGGLVFHDNAVMHDKRFAIFILIVSRSIFFFLCRWYDNIVTHFPAMNAGVILSST